MNLEKIRCFKSGKFVKTKTDDEIKANKQNYRKKHREKYIEYFKNYRSLRENKDKHNVWRRNKKISNSSISSRSSY